MRPRYRPGPTWLLLLALGVPARAGDLELGGEGYAFTLRDTGYSTLQTFDPNSERPQFELPEPLRLEGLGWRARAGLVFHGGAERVGVVAQHVGDDARASRSSRLGGFTLEQDEDAEAAFTTVDARYEHRVSSSERFELRVAGGYRFARLTQSRELGGSCPVCRDLLDARFARLVSESRLTGHGLRAGLSSGVRLVGPLHLESEAGLSLLAATEDNASTFFDVASGKSHRRRSLATWDLSARLRAEWHGVSLGAGYRFERWSQVTPLVVDSDPGFDGFTFGLAWRFKL